MTPSRRPRSRRSPSGSSSHPRRRPRASASSFTTFRRVILPLITPAILSSFLIAFVVSIDEYAISSFLAANSFTYPVYLFGQIRQAEHLPPMIPVATVMLVVSFVLVLLAEVIRRRGDRRVGLSP